VKSAGAILALTLSSCLCGQARFAEHVIATDLRGGYQVTPYDMNRDGRTDLIALASGMTELVWFENPNWTRHVLATGMSRMINLAACNGMEEIVVAQEFNNQPSRSPGVVSVLTPGPDRMQPWTVREIDRLSTSHRLRCAEIDGTRRPVVINAPLAGANAAAPDYRDRVPLVYYRPGEWKRIAIGDQTEGVMHGIFVTPWTRGRRDCILTASFVGLHSWCLGANGAWERGEIHKGDPAAWPKGGASDVALGLLGRQRYLAAIEPWHGNQVAIYTAQRGGEWVRHVIDDTLVDGHTILTVDLNGDGRMEVVAGYRGKGHRVLLYTAEDAAGKNWKRTLIDDGGIAAAACAAADLNKDRKPDLACIGAATTNLKWYENLGAGK
jgi:hypothetical protein